MPARENPMGPAAVDLADETSGFAVQKVEDWVSILGAQLAGGSTP